MPVRDSQLVANRSYSPTSLDEISLTDDGGPRPSGESPGVAGSHVAAGSGSDNSRTGWGDGLVLGRNMRNAPGESPRLRPSQTLEASMMSAGVFDLTVLAIAAPGLLVAAEPAAASA